MGKKGKRGDMGETYPGATPLTLRPPPHADTSEGRLAHAHMCHMSVGFLFPPLAIDMRGCLGVKL
eukprot:5383952-Prorocentrum_lima.AAC.1